MSEFPSTPPELSSREDTPPASLLARLHQITGLTDPGEHPPPEDHPAGPPPVDRLIVWLREATGVLAACGIAVAVALAVIALWLWERTLEGRLYARRWQQRRASLRLARKEEEARLAAVASVPPPVVSGQLSVISEQLSVGSEMVEPVAESSAALVLAEPEEVLAEEEPALCVVAAPDQTEPALAPVRRRVHLRLVATVAVLCALPALLLVPAIRYYFTSALGWGNAVVVAGESGWLFPRPVATAPPSLRETAAALRASGAALIAVSIPSKAAVYPEMLDSSADGGLHRSAGIAAAHKELMDAGALVFDLGPVIHALKAADAAGDPPFRPQGSQLSPRGMEKAASATASFLQQQPGYAALPLQPLHAELARASLSAPTEDLAAAFPSRRYHDTHPPQPLHFIRLLNPEKKPLPSDAASPVVVIGGNAVKLYDEPVPGLMPDGVTPGERLSAGISQYLALYLSTPLEVHTAPDSLAAAKDWLAVRPEAERKAKRFIVWVIADDDLLR